MHLQPIYVCFVCLSVGMAMVIDDRLKVWEDRDQSHVHVVPAFAPYYDPQAEVHKFWY
mgnify:CR=1 FL=1